MVYKLIIIVWCAFLFNLANSQSLLDELNAENDNSSDTIYAIATFKAPRLINGQSVETVGKNGLNAVISHRFGNINSGRELFFGLDFSSIRLGIEYGLLNNLDFGIGRGNEQQLVDLNLKYRFLKQSEGAVYMPVSVSFYSSLAIRTDKGNQPGRDYSLVQRFNYVHEFLVARKFSEIISLQFTPGLVHRNLTILKSDENIVPYIGFGGRYKITNRMAFTTEYYLVLANNTSQKFVNPLAFGIDVETGGHIFQLHFTNSRGMHEKIMIPENGNDWLKGDIVLGFNIIRHFVIRKK